MNNLQSKTLAQLVNANYRTAAIFEKYNLDFCCRGKRTLLQACNESQLPFETIERELELVQNKLHSQGWQDMSLGQLADHIVVTHHAFVKSESPSITGYLDKIAAKHGDRHPELLPLAETFHELAQEMASHMEKEEQIVFPLLKAYESALHAADENDKNLTGLTAPIAMMEDEHDHAGRLLDRIRELTGNFIPPADACTTYKLAFASLQAFQTDLHQHVHLENNILFPRAIRLMEETKAASLN